MTRPDELASSLDKTAKEFFGCWQKVRARSSEKSVHDLRVNTRRLIAALELARALSNNADVADARRRFKKVLKRMGPLRDLQVQLETLMEMPRKGLLADIQRLLERREARAIEKIRNHLTRSRKQQLSGAIEHVRAEILRVTQSATSDALHRSVERIVSVRQNDFSKAKSRFYRLKPLSEDALHEMRIALKKLRYITEAAQPLLGASAKKRAREMHGFQQLMGESRDLALLRSELETWAKKRGKTIAVVPVLEQLRERRELLLKKIVDSSGDLDRFVQAERPQPAAETTHIAITAVHTDTVTVH